MNDLAVSPVLVASMGFQIAKFRELTKVSFRGGRGISFSIAVLILRD